MWRTGGILDLHSSMDRLKAFQQFFHLNCDKNLHSSMDRLKACNVHKIKSFHNIYIPVWID